MAGTGTSCATPTGCSCPRPRPQAAQRLLAVQKSREERGLYANALRALGDLYVRTARLAEAEARYGEALPIFRSIESRLGEANTLQALGDLYVWTARDRLGILLNRTPNSRLHRLSVAPRRGCQVLSLANV